MRGNLMMATVFLSTCLAVSAFAQEFTVNPGDVPGDEPDYSPYVDRNIPGRVFWGDTHHHTTNSPDAGLVGNTLGPAEAYRVAFTA